MRRIKNQQLLTMLNSELSYWRYWTNYYLEQGDIRQAEIHACQWAEASSWYGALNTGRPLRSYYPPCVEMRQQALLRAS